MVYNINKGSETMEPYKAQKLPVEYKIDKELLQLLAEANEKYGQYKLLIETFKFDSRFFLNSIILSESLKSTQIEGTQISQDEVYYLKYKDKELDDEIIEIRNIKKMIEFSEDALKKDVKINISLINDMHKILLNSVRGAEKNPGKLRTNQNWIGPRGAGIEEAVYVPPMSDEVPLLLDNLFEYMSDKYVDSPLINLAISHAQFETIHAYSDGNGRLGRALIPIHLSILKEEKPILFLSEVIELYKPTYNRTLNESRKGNMGGFIKFFLQCIIEQCNSNIYKIKSINQIYNEDLQKVSKLKGYTAYKAMPALIKMIVFTKQELMEEIGCHRNTLSLLIENLIKLDIIVEEESTYKYKRAYDVFVSN